MNTDHDGRRPGRPSTEDGPAVTRAALLETAQRLIADNGYDRTSIRDLAREAGVTHGTVQHHFRTKQDIWQAVVDEVIVPRIRTVMNQLSEDANEGPEAAIANRLRQALTNEGFSGSLLIDQSEGASDRLNYLVDATDSLRDDMSSQIHALVAAGLLRDVKPSTLRALDIALACLGAAGGALLAFAEVDISDEEQRESLIAEISDIYLYGVMPRA